jgi:hypothetical protein
MPCKVQAQKLSTPLISRYVTLVRLKSYRVQRKKGAKSFVTQVLKLDFFVKKPCRHRSCACARIVMTSLMYPRQWRSV